ncbi:MAG: transposase, partial [Acetobacteraceae bacterium]|nr:transposase [Acetobacteraceae bacterium]
MSNGARWSLSAWASRAIPGGGDNRLFVEAVLWIVRTGSPWRDLPPGSGSGPGAWSARSSPQPRSGPPGGADCVLGMSSEKTWRKSSVQCPGCGGRRTISRRAYGSPPWTIGSARIAL